jgi:RimJ/RimL family protein N-acetyltransferase
MINPFLIGEQLYLRPLEISDLERCQRWFNDPDVRRFLSSVRPLSQEAERTFLEEAARRASGPDADLIMAIVLKKDDRHIGNAGLHHIHMVDRHAEFGIVIGEKDFWQKGYGQEATRLVVDYGFNTLNLHRVYLRVHDDNPRAMAAYEKVGFRREGVFRQALYRHGKYHDVVFMGLLRGEMKP